MVFIWPCVSIDKNNTVERRARTLNISVEINGHTSREYFQTLSRIINYVKQAFHKAKQR